MTKDQILLTIAQADIGLEASRKDDVKLRTMLDNAQDLIKIFIFKALNEPFQTNFKDLLIGIKELLRAFRLGSRNNSNVLDELEFKLDKTAREISKHKARPRKPKALPSPEINHEPAQQAEEQGVITPAGDATASSGAQKIPAGTKRRTSLGKRSLSLTERGDRLNKEAHQGYKELDRRNAWRETIGKRVVKLRDSASKLNTRGAIPDGCRIDKGVDFPAGTSQGNGRGDALSTPATKNLSLLPPVVDNGTTNSAVPTDSELATEMENYSNAPKWQRDHADKYMFLLDATKGMTKSEIKVFCNTYNRQHPNSSTSYPSIMRARKAYEEEGIWGLFPNYGLNCATAEIDEELMTYFKDLYMKEGGPSAYSCWVMCLGKSGRSAKDFPSCHTFLRRLKQVVPQKAINLARKGFKKWNRTDGPYIERDYSDVRPGQCWVSDHAQVDVGTTTDGKKPCYPWATAWRDFKTGKMLAYFLHREPPNSDHILQSFYYAALKYGLPDEIYIDNGKDYRCRDFAGGRTSKIKVTFDESRACIVRNLNIIVHYARPYNAQSKPIERDFLTIKTWYSKHQVGYRGGNVVERPESNAVETKNGSLRPFEEVDELLGLFIEEVINENPSRRSRIRQGKTPNLLWNDERTERRHVDKDALKLFCMRTSKPIFIGRRGAKDPETQQTYWGEWMTGYTKSHIFLRRDIKEYGTAWCFAVEDDKFLGVAKISALAAPALAKTDISHAQLKSAAAQKARMTKQYKQYLQGRAIGDPRENLQNQIAGMAAINAGLGNTYEPKEPQVVRMNSTKMDDVIRQKKAMDEEGLYDMSLTAPTRPAEPEILLWDCDRTEEVRDDDD